MGPHSMRRPAAPLWRTSWIVFLCTRSTWPWPVFMPVFGLSFGVLARQLAVMISSLGPQRSVTGIKS